MNNQNEKNYLIHYGNKNSGRYPRGSGQNPHQHDGLKKHDPEKRGAFLGATIAGVPATVGGGLAGGWLAKTFEKGILPIGAEYIKKTTTQELVTFILAGAGMAGLSAAAIGGAIGLVGGAIVKHMINKKKGQ